MTRVARIGACLTAAAAALVALSYLDPNWIQSLAPDLPGVANLRQQIQQDGEFCDQLEASFTQLAARYRQKEEVAEAVIAGRLGLSAAIHKFRELEEPKIGPLDQAMAVHYGRQVVAYIRAHFRDFPSSGEAVEERLQREFEQYYPTRHLTLRN